ncbi:MAG: hemerythrin domain-containing protein [Rhizonema sp. PD37]|nr:hemerythrin domain-containing protein [Rhizonema sp. PD37]
MVATLDDNKRSAIAVKLADVKALQQLFIENEQQFLKELNDPEVRDSIQNMLNDDKKNLGILETVISQYGIQAEPKETFLEMVKKVHELMQGSKLSLYEKVFQHELLKHQQVMSGIIIHKSAQTVGADVLLAITPLNTVNFENRAHQEQLKGILEILGVRELTGQDADQGIWARVQDGMAALSGVLGSVVTQNTDKKDMNVQDAIRIDHAKVNTLFTELLASNDPQKLQEYFGQIYKDLNVQVEAKEQVIYPKVRPFYGEHETQELYEEQAQMKRMLEEIKASNPSSSQFKDKIKQLMDVFGDHIRQEESTMFAAIRNNFSTEQSEELTTAFKAAKVNLQEKMDVVSK